MDNYSIFSTSGIGYSSYGSAIMVHLKFNQDDVNAHKWGGAMHILGWEWKRSIALYTPIIIDSSHRSHLEERHRVTNLITHKCWSWSVWI